VRLLKIRLPDNLIIVMAVDDDYSVKGVTDGRIWAKVYSPPDPATASIVSDVALPEGFKVSAYVPFYGRDAVDEAPIDAVDGNEILDEDEPEIDDDFDDYEDYDDTGDFDVDMWEDDENLETDETLQGNFPDYESSYFSDDDTDPTSGEISDIPF
jgi:hypothetical protein